MAKKTTSDEPVEPREVSAVGFASISTSGNRELSQYITQAVQMAILQANAEGIASTEENTPILRERMEAARERAREEFLRIRRR